VTWIVDASVALRWLLKEERHANSQKILERMLETPSSFAVPELFLFETYAVLCRLHPQPVNAFRIGILTILQNGIYRKPMTAELSAMAKKFVDLGLTGYDACYAALAEELNGTWLTFDQKAHRCIESKNISHLLEPDLPQGF
jgi:predicted nucleic acid-binding protein